MRQADIDPSEIVPPQWSMKSRQAQSVQQSKERIGGFNSMEVTMLEMRRQYNKDMFYL